MTPKTSSFYLPSPDDLYKDLCRELPNDLNDLHWQDNQALLAESPEAPRSSASVRVRQNRGAAGYREFQSDVYDMQWHKHQIESLDSSTYSGTLRSFTASQSGDLRIVSVECLESNCLDFEDWYVSAVDPSGGEKLYKSVHDENVYYILFESAEDASLVYEFLRTVASTRGYIISLCTIDNARIVLSSGSNVDSEPLNIGCQQNSGAEMYHLEPRPATPASLVYSTDYWRPNPDSKNFARSYGGLRRRLSLSSSSESSTPPGRFVASDPRSSHFASSETDLVLACSQGKIIHLIMAQNTCLDKVIDMMSKYGKITKIIMFTKDTSIQALIEYVDNQSASRSVRECDVQGMSVQFSRLSELKIQQNNNRAWDFTLAPTRVISARSSSPISLISIGFNEILSMKKLPKEMRDWLKSINDHQGTTTNTDGAKLEPPGPFGNVIIVYNLSCSSINEIFNIFSIYGICTRVKFLRQKDSCALIQYSDPVYASFAKYFLSHTHLWTSPGLQISYSKIDNVKLGSGQNSSPHAAPADLMSRAYSQSEQRFCEVPKYGNCVSFPSETIFIASIADVTPKARILELFGSVGKILAHDLRLPYSGGPKKPHMLLQYTDVETALRAIATFHNLVLDGSQIKIAFSKVRLIR